MGRIQGVYLYCVVALNLESPVQSSQKSDVIHLPRLAHPNGGGDERTAAGQGFALVVLNICQCRNGLCLGALPFQRDGLRLCFGASQRSLAFSLGDICPGAVSPHP